MRTLEASGTNLLPDVFLILYFRAHHTHTCSIHSLENTLDSPSVWWNPYCFYVENDYRGFLIQEGSFIHGTCYS